MNVTLLTAGSIGPAQSPTLTLNSVPSAQTALVFITGPVTMAVDAPNSTAGWVRDYFKVSQSGFAVFRLPSASNGGGTITLKITTNGPRYLAYVAAVGNIGLPQYGVFGRASSFHALETDMPQDATTYGTDVHTFAQTAHTFAVFPLVDIKPGDAALDATSYGQGYAELGDSGISPSDPNEESRIWVAYQPNMAMNNDGVSATFNQAISVTTAGWSGMAAYDVDYPVTITDANGNELTPYLKTSGGLTLLRPTIAP